MTDEILYRRPNFQNIIRKKNCIEVITLQYTGCIQNGAKYLHHTIL
jgi:hypothetical protein